MEEKYCTHAYYFGKLWSVLFGNDDALTARNMKQVLFGQI